MFWVFLAVFLHFWPCIIFIPLLWRNKSELLSYVFVELSIVIYQHFTLWHIYISIEFTKCMYICIPRNPQYCYWYRFNTTVRILRNEKNRVCVVKVIWTNISLFYYSDKDMFSRYMLGRKKIFSGQICHYLIPPSPLAKWSMRLNTWL